VLVARVVHHEVQHEPDASLARLVYQPAEVAQAAVSRVHAEVISDVVPAVPARRRVDGMQPDRGDAQTREVIESSHQPLEVTYPVVVAVLEQADVDGVDDTGPVPAGQHLNLPRL